ncbi:S-adenosyl-L-methionine-dependent methyltransferase [Nemania sp. FL0916]|nr:S-adenosyl-L-methionine-dependent methyltransferase [Nemania sp. FL0916]
MAEGAVDINRTVFNEEAANYDEKHRKLHERLTREFHERLDFIGVDWASEDEDEDDTDGDEVEASDKKPKREVRLLDYACGTGMMSRALAPYVTQCVGMDIAESMVLTYNTRAENQGLTPDEMHAVLGNLTSETVSDALLSPELFGFDIAVVGGGFHHFGDPALAAKRLVERLKPGGVLLIWDFLPHGPLHQHEHHHDHSHQHRQHQHDHDHHDHGHGHAKDNGKQDTAPDVYRSVMHHGFSEAQMREIFTGAGAGDGFEMHVVGGGFTLGHHGHGPEAQGNDKDKSKKDGSTDQNNDEDKDREARRRQVFFARGTKKGAAAEG